MTERIAMYYCVDFSGMPTGRCHLRDVRPCGHLLRHDLLRIERPLSDHCGDDGSWAPSHRYRWAERARADRAWCKRRQYLRPRATTVALAELLSDLKLRWSIASSGFHWYRKRHTLDRLGSGLVKVLARFKWQLR